MNKHQPESGHDIEKLLTDLTPQADAHFQEKLERQVLAAYLQKKEGDKVKANGHLVTYADVMPKLGMNHNRQRRWSISLAATLLMVFFVGALIAFVGGLPGPSREIHYSALQQMTPSLAATPTPNVIGRVQVVVTSMRLPRYSRLSASSLEIQYRRADLMPEDVFFEIESLVGGVLLVDAAENMPLTRSKVVLPPNAEEAQPVLVTTMSIPAVSEITPAMVTVVFMNPNDVPDDAYMQSPLRYGLTGGHFQAVRDVAKGEILLNSQVTSMGPYFDGGTVTTYFPYFPNSLELGPVNLRPVVMTSQAIQRGTMITEEMLTIAYWPNEIALDGLYEDIEAVVGQTTLTDLRPYSPILTGYFAPEPDDETAREIDAGSIAIAVPMPDDRFFYGFQVGDTISITASFLFVESYEVNGVQITPSTDNEAFPQLVVQEVIPDAKIVKLDGMAVTEESDLQVMVLAVTPEQGEVLAWLIDSQIPLQYRIVIPVSGED